MIYYTILCFIILYYDILHYSIPFLLEYAALYCTVLHYILLFSIIIYSRQNTICIRKYCFIRT